MKRNTTNWTMETKDCLFCKNIFTAPVWAKRKVCSIKCSGKLPKSRMLGKLHSEKSRKKMSDIKKGIIPKNILRGDFKGENHPNWKGGVSRGYKTGYYSLEYKNWRKAVFLRDDFKCCECDSDGYITAHHIKSFAHYPDLRFELSNGKTLCEECHKKTDNYKGRAKGSKIMSISHLTKI